MEITANVNCRAKVVLTGIGSMLLNKYIADEASYLTDEQKIHVFGQVNFKSGDSFTCMFWELMRIFGEYFYHGCEAPFLENKIILNDGI